MLLTLGANSLRSLLKGRGSAAPKLGLLDLPRYTREELGLNGLTITTDLLTGATRDIIAGLRDAGDKAGCAALLLVEPDPLPFGEVAEKKGDEAIERMRRVISAAQLLGCSSAAFSVKGKDDEASFERAADRIREVVDHAERLEINVLIRPAKGLTEDADRLIELIKKVGGFRIGSLPDFQDASESKDPATYLRRITPYASALLASTIELEQVEVEESAPPKRPEKKAPKEDPKEEEKPAEAEDQDDDDAEGDLEFPEDELLELDDLLDVPPPIHRPYELTSLLEAVLSVGYDQALTIDYRGSGDGTLGVQLSRDAIEASIEELAQRG